MTRPTTVAVLSAAAAALLSTAVQAAPASYSVDPKHTFVTFEVKHFGTSTNRGRFDNTKGAVTLDRAAKTGRVEVTIDTTAINTGTPAFDKHLKEGFFNAAQYPTATFVGDKFSFSGDKVTEVAGQLTLHGVTKPVTLKANGFNCYENPMLKREVCGGDFETTIQRSAFGITELQGAVPDEVRLVIQVEAIKQ
ncbi:MAG: YceI family protein [Aquabacterium sp.]|nr:YceI family protein [Aquabacterium sp.]